MQAKLYEIQAQSAKSKAQQKS